MGKEDTTKRDDYQRVLIIDRNAGLERKFEFAESFDKSFFRDNYYSAFALTQKILARNGKMEKEVSEGKEIWSREQRKLYNIITFCGERGSGKTSVMDSVVEALQGKSEDYVNFIKQYEKNKSAEEKEDHLDQLLEKYEFICMDSIDASLLEEKEDILDVILSILLQKVQETQQNRNPYYPCGQEGFCDKEEICRRLERIYRDKGQVKQRGDMDRRYAVGESSVEILAKLAGSLGIRKQLQELVKMCLQLLSRNRKKVPYLVLSIDDLDLHGNAYEMLEQLHRYLIIPRVIIYLAVSEREIQSVCKKHFEKIYEGPEELTMLYLEKVLPYSRRIYLPATFSGDFFNVITKSDLNSHSDEKLNEEQILNLYSYPVKRFLLREIMCRTRVFYDGCGLGTHFYEIENLRTLINTYYLVESMKRYKPEELLNFTEEILKKHKETFAQDYEKLRNDIVGRMAKGKLNSPEQRRIFDQYYKEDFSSNGEYLVRETARLINEEAPDYNYGALMGSLYILGKKRQDFKPLIQCILALATIELTQNYMYIYFMEDINSLKKWNEYISGSVIGNWGNQIFPKVKIGENVSTRIAYVRECKGFFCLEDILGIKWKNQEKKEICRQLISSNGMIETVVLVCAFLTGEPKVTFEISGSKDEKPSITLSVSECTFDILGFVIHSMDCKKFVDTVKEVLLDALERYADVEKEEIGNLVKESPILQDYISWDKCYHGAVLPIYSLDIMYNMLKRVKKKMEQKFPRDIEKKDFLKVLQTFYRQIGDCLIEEDLFYGTRTVTENKIEEKNEYTNFYKAFLENPFVKYFVREKKTEEKTIEEKILDGKQWVRPGPTTETSLEEMPEWFRSLFAKMIG